MPRVFNLYVIAPEHVPKSTGSAGALEEALRRFGARWAQVESKATGFLGACDEIGRQIGAPVVRGAIGTFSPVETRNVHDALAAAPPDVLARIDADPVLARTFWALHDTSEEAVGRNACMVIECVG